MRKHNIKMTQAEIAYIKKAIDRIITNIENINKKNINNNKDIAGTFPLSMYRDSTRNLIKEGLQMRGYEINEITDSIIEIKNKDSI